MLALVNCPGTAELMGEPTMSISDKKASLLTFKIKFEGVPCVAIPLAVCAAGG